MEGRLRAAIGTMHIQPKQRPIGAQLTNANAPELYGWSAGELYHAYREDADFPSPIAFHINPSFWLWNMPRVLRYLRKKGRTQ